MTRCAVPALTIPTLLTVIVACQMTPPKWMVTVPASPVQPEVAAPKREIPKILAVDKRIKNRLNNLRPDVKQRLAQVARRLPKKVTLLVTSAYRTRTEQARLRPTFGVKARPGHSPHEDGRAIDLNVLVDGERINPRKNKAVIGEVMAAAGFKYIGHHDPVHFVVPKTKIDHSVTSAPELEVMTMGEAQEIQAEEQLARQQATLDVSVQPALVAP